MRFRAFLGALALTAIWTSVSPLSYAADSAVVLMYHRFEDSRVPAANTPLDQLEAQIEELRTGGYTVLPLPTIIDALRARRPLPDKTIAITIDDTWRSAYDTAWPQFRRAGFPVTLFVVTDEIDGNNPDSLTWGELREMVASGLVTVGTQGATRGHFPLLGPANLADSLARVRSRLETELGRVPTLFAWPYGEMSRDLVDVIRGAGYVAAFGQHSGPLWSGADFYYLPRFALNETYGEIDRFRLAAGTISLPAVDVTPADPRLETNPPAFGFTLAEPVPGVEYLACYTSHAGRAQIEQLGPRVEVRIATPFPSGRGRINCTAPSLDGRWRWFGWQFSVP